MKKRRAASIAATILLLLAGGCRGTDSPLAAAPAPTVSPPPVWLEAEDVTANDAFELADPAEAADRGASLYCWWPYLRNAGAFARGAALLADLGVDRLYQQLTCAELAMEDTADMVAALADMGVQTVLLTGDREWQETGLDEYRALIDALDEFNSTIGADHPIPGVALDVEYYTTDAWRAEPERCFAEHIELMEQAYDYAHEKGLFVVQVIPAVYDEVDRELFERFAERCCDELSVMNYVKDVAVSRIWNEVHVCRRLGKPIETIYETQPLSEYYGVTEDVTYFYDGLDALAEDYGQMERVYGDVGLAYHHYASMHALRTGGVIVSVYLYTTDDDPARDENGQPAGIPFITLTGDDGSVLTGTPYRPYPEGEHGESCYLVFGAKRDVAYTVSLGGDGYEPQPERNEPMAFSGGDPALAFNVAFHVRPK